MYVSRPLRQRCRKRYPADSASYQYDAAGRITSITQNLWALQAAVPEVPATATTPAIPAVPASTYAVPISWSAGYDTRDRLTSFARPSASSLYTYDANSNRLTSVDTTTSDTDLDGDFDQADYQKALAQNLNVDADSSRLLGFSQTQTITQTTAAGKVKVSGSNTQITYSLDAAGNLTSDGLRLFDYDASNRLSQVMVRQGQVSQSGEASKIVYLHNALGQRVFKSEPQVAQTAPDETVLGTDFISWLKKNFGWLFAQAQANATLGDSFVYGDASIGSFNLLGQYGNGGSKSAGRIEYLYLPTEGGTAQLIGIYKGGRFYAVHTDHLGTPRRITDDAGQVVWQWAYSAFGDNKPSGVLKATANPKAALTNVPTLLKATTPTLAMNLRFPGQYFDEESNLGYNYFRSYRAAMGRFDQADPIGLDGGLNRYSYVGGNPLMYTDPEGLLAQGIVDFGAGLGDVILFGQGQRLRDLFDVDGGIDQCSDEYSAGEWSGVAASMATGLAGGLKAAGAKGTGKEFSHWIPNRMGGPRSTWNGNFVPTATHALSDPYRYRFMPRSWKAQNPMPNAASQQWTRIPNAYKGGAAGGAYGAAGAAQGGCSCSR
jgi:RHS repeat-associated protein